MITGSNLTTQLIPIPPFVLNIPGRNSSATVELVFLASDVPPLGFKSYYVNKEKGDSVLEGFDILEDVIVTLQAWVGLKFINGLKLKTCL